MSQKSSEYIDIKLVQTAAMYLNGSFPRLSKILEFGGEKGGRNPPHLCKKICKGGRNPPHLYKKICKGGRNLPHLHKKFSRGGEIPPRGEFPPYVLSWPRKTGEYVSSVMFYIKCTLWLPTVELFVGETDRRRLWGKRKPDCPAAWS